MRVAIILISSILIFVYLVFEFASIIAIGSYYIKGEGIKMLEKELNKSDNITNNMISLTNKTKLKGYYVAKNYFSFLFPYYLSGSKGTITYPILRYSKDYYLIKNKFKSSRVF